MNHVVRHIQEERLCRIAVNERNRMFSVLRGQLGLFFVRDFRHDRVVALNQRQVRPALQAFLHRQIPNFRMERPHVVAVRQTEVFIESVLQRQELSMVTQMPFSKTGSGVVFLFAHLSQRHLIAVNADIRSRPQSPLDADSDVVTAGHQAGS